MSGQLSLSGLDLPRRNGELAFDAPWQSRVFALAAAHSLGFLEERAQLQSYDTDRFNAQRAGLELAIQHPLGIGPGQFERYVSISAHSLYVRSLAEQGFLGLGVVLLIVLATLVLAIQNVLAGRDTYGIGSAPLLAAWVGLVANSAFVDSLHWRHLWLVAALIWAGAMRRTRAPPPSPAPARPRPGIVRAPKAS